ncbi:hypothetical protein CDAR_282041 [Caerostris darwini]|uniref:Secreted protein n=1 Tax=Caerostris darwini TaxID=1538125 RepID=A0AAV4WPF4_9ARAC|nr:hypothetical protein CDAR_282041 [Caerostris darwini]
MMPYVHLQTNLAVFANFALLRLRFKFTLPNPEQMAVEDTGSSNTPRRVVGQDLETSSSICSSCSYVFRFP